MMYVGFPQLSLDERLTSLPSLEARSLKVSPQQLMETIPEAGEIKSLRLTSLLNRPIYQVKTVEGNYYSRFADSGDMLPKLTPQIARQIAKTFIADNSAIKSYKKTDIDQWTVSSSLNSHRPLHKISFENDESTTLYISSKTGEVIRDSTKTERVWNWLGANLHWLYPRVLRQHTSVWHWLVVILSSTGLLAILTGSIIGYLRLRIRKKYRGKKG